MEQIVNVDLRRIWSIEQELLDVVHKVCTENNLRYSLAYGTLLGAVRHKGFIPWDDDVDIIMPRNDYEKLIEIWESVASKEYILQNERTDEDFNCNFTKIRKEGTVFLQDEKEWEKKYHKGIFIDIFPGDRKAPGKVWGIIQFFACAMNLLFTRGYTSGSKGIIGLVEIILLWLPHNIQMSLRNMSGRWIQKWNDRTELGLIFPCTIRDCRKVYRADLFDDLVETSFCGKNYMAVRDFHGYLTFTYGDYMMLPPEEERTWTHHPVWVKIG